MVLQLSDEHVVPFSSFPELLRVYFLVPISSFSLIGPEMRPVRSYLTSHRQERTPREGEMTGKLSFLKCVFALYTRLCLGLIELMELNSEVEYSLSMTQGLTSTPALQVNN